MPEQFSHRHLVDKYLRDELTAVDAEEFEVALLESSDMQLDLETTLVLRAALERASGSNQEQPGEEPLQVLQSEKADWKRMALAASVVLAVVSTVMWWKVGTDAASLESQLQALAVPRAEVLRVPVNIMRSVGDQVPDVIVRKPAGHAAVQFDIELGSLARAQDQLQFSLLNQEGNIILGWASAPQADGRATALVSNEQIPASRLWLQISTPEGERLERRLLEFRE